MNILNIDANYWATQGLSALLNDKGHQLLACASISEAKQVLIYQHVDALILELKTEVDDVEATYVFLRLLQALYPHVNVVILTEITDSALLNFFANGLSSVIILSKAIALKKIIQGLNLSGENNGNIRFRGGNSSLSPQEFHMLKWFSQYSSQREIAMRLNLNNKTISHYKRSISLKLHCGNNVQFHDCLMKYGFNRNIL